MVPNYVAFGVLGSYVDTALTTDCPYLCRNRTFYLPGYIVAEAGIEPATQGL